MFHDANQESGSDALLSVISEAGILYGCLVKFAGNQFDDVVGALSFMIGNIPLSPL